MDSTQKTTHISAKTWKIYVDYAENVDAAYIKRQLKEMDNLLLFATLFSAMQTAFVIESYKNLLPSSSDIEIQRTLWTLQSRNDPADLAKLEALFESFRPATSAVRVNALWFTSIIISIFAAFMAILAKQWLSNMLDGLSSTIEMKGHQYQLRHNGFRLWSLPEILSMIPQLLHISVLLFLVGLVDFLWSINQTIAIIATILVVIVFLCYLLSHICAVIDPECPFKTSLTSILIAPFIDLLSYADPWHISTKLISLSPISTPYLPIDDLLEFARAVVMIVPAFQIFSKFIETQLEVRRRLIMEEYLPTNYYLRIREERCIATRADSLDAQALARMIHEWSLWTEDSPRSTLAEELSSFTPMVSYRRLFIRSGAVKLLASEAQLAFRQPGTSNTEQASPFRYLTTLISLLTEVDEDDPRTLQVPLVTHIPLHYDGAINSALREKEILDILESLASASRDISQVPHLISNSMVLVRLRVLSARTYTFSRSTLDLESLSDKFTAFLDHDATVASLDEGELLMIVNTAIYILMRARRLLNRFHVRRHHDYVEERLLKTLTKLMELQKDLGVPVRRQICWVIWLCSQDSDKLRHCNLIPNVKTAVSIIKAFAPAIVPRDGRAPLILAVFVLWGNALAAERADQASDDHFIVPLDDHLPLFLAQCNAGILTLLREQETWERILKQVVRICGFLYYSDHVAATQAIDSALRLLLAICEHSRGGLTGPVSVGTGLHRLSFSSFCGLVQHRIDASHTKDWESLSTNYIFQKELPLPAIVATTFDQLMTQLPSESWVELVFRMKNLVRKASGTNFKQDVVNFMEQSWSIADAPRVAAVCHLSSLDRVARA